MIKRILTLWSLTSALALAVVSPVLAADWVQYEGGEGPGQGKHIVFITGDEEYRSEEAMPMMARILSDHHGFKCTVLFALNPETGEIDPNNQTNIVGMKHVADADLVVLFTRFRELPDDQMKYFVDYAEAGGPIIGLRTSTHAFRYSRDKESPYAKYDFSNREWRGGFGQQVLGETWINHHGRHGSESCRGVVDGMNRNHPILTGVSNVWGPTDVYGVRNLPDDADVLLHGLTLSGMTPDSPANTDKTLMPVAWVRHHEWDTGNVSRIFNTTMGAATDLVEPGLRRVLVNAALWALEMEDAIQPDLNIEPIGAYNPTQFGFNGFQTGMKPDDFAAN